MPYPVLQVLLSLQAIDGEDPDYLMYLVEKHAKEPLTPARKAHLQAPKVKHGTRRTWQDDAFDALEEAYELGEL